ncbi:MAG: TAXI family TRAP transporter solute-binding subunit [Candidatus Bipolaricaulota bacterium]|nr:TAXI family TRAP transporter solute-binding subunit [Candidatus Bipolaricaulota bacterium]MDW8031269.1 TAXI family TRAP transporter solute-binding subunit [Candidatus Bipolaricaulota bacterium]
MKRWMLVAAGLLIVGLLMLGVGDEILAQRRISLATGGVGGVYYPLGGAMAKLWTDNIPGIIVTAETSGASVANARLIQKGDVQLAFIQNDIASYAYHGEEMFKAEGALRKVLGMAMLYPEVIQIVTLKGKGIAKVEDLKGKRVAVGAPGSGTEANARQILEVHGLTYADIDEQFLPFAEAATALKDGRIDAAFLTAGIPTAAVIDIAATHDIALVPITRAKASELEKRWTFYDAFTIPANTYRGQTAPVETVAVLAMLVAHAELDSDLVEQMLDVLFLTKSLDTLCKTHVRGCDIKRERALIGMPIPLHPGAARYYSKR